MAAVNGDAAIVGLLLDTGVDKNIPNHVSAFYIPLQTTDM